jgi:hypothetical protein
MVPFKALQLKKELNAKPYFGHKKMRILDYMPPGGPSRVNKAFRRPERWMARSYAKC